MRDLDEIERDAKAATPGPWNDDGVSVNGEDEDGNIAMEWVANGDYAGHADDARFIAAARTDVPALVARVRELQATQDRHLKLIAELARATPYDGEVVELRAQVAKLIAEVGTLRGKVRDGR